MSIAVSVRVESDVALYSVSITNHAIERWRRRYQPTASAEQIRNTLTKKIRTFLEIGCLHNGINKIDTGFYKLVLDVQGYRVIVVTVTTGLHL